jgi:hypothetical protein
VVVWALSLIPSALWYWHALVIVREFYPYHMFGAGGNPAVFYYAHRKGWHFLERHGIYNGNPNDSGELIADLKILRARGATHIAFYRATTWWLDYYSEFAEYLARTSTPVMTSREMRIFEFKKE